MAQKTYKLNSNGLGAGKPRRTDNEIRSQALQIIERIGPLGDQLMERGFNFADEVHRLYQDILDFERTKDREKGLRLRLKWVQLTKDHIVPRLLNTESRNLHEHTHRMEDGREAVEWQRPEQVIDASELDDDRD